MFVWPRDANPYLSPADRRRVFASVRREADRAWCAWLSEHPEPVQQADPWWTDEYRAWLASWPLGRTSLIYVDHSGVSLLPGIGPRFCSIPV